MNKRHREEGELQNGRQSGVRQIGGSGQISPQSDREHPAESSSAGKRTLSIWRIMLFGLSGPPLQMTGNITAFYFSIFLLEVAHINPALVSVISFAGRVWDGITDPLIGQFLSRSPQYARWGKIRPWILISGLAGSIIFFFMWWPGVANVDSQGAKFAYYLVMHLAYCTAITCYHIPYTSATVLLSEVAADRDAATAARIVFELVFTIIGSAVFGVVISTKRVAISCGNFSANGTESLTFRSSEEQNTYKLAAAIIALVFMSCGLIGFASIKERVKSSAHSNENVITNIVKVVRFRPYVALMLAFLFLSLGIQTIQANLGLFTTHRLKIGWHMTFGLMCILFVAALLVPLVHIANGRFGKKNVFILGVLTGFPCILLTQMLEVNNIIMYYIVTCLSGATVSVAMMQPWSMLPDVIEAFHKKEGERKEATFYSLYAFFTKFAAGISLAVSQLGLWFGNYDIKSCQQPESVANILRWLMGPGPMFCLFISLAIIVLCYPSDLQKRASQWSVEIALGNEGGEASAEQADASTGTSISLLNKNF